MKNFLIQRVGLPMWMILLILLLDLIILFT